MENSTNTMEQLLALQSKLTSDCDKIEKLERKIKNEIITLTKEVESTKHQIDQVCFLIDTWLSDLIVALGLRRAPLCLITAPI